MCTAVISFAPGSPFPVLLIGVRDEFLARPWQPPGRHWPDRPALIGGRDVQAGGTWLAVDPGAPRAATVLNGRGRPAPEQGRSTRGELPLRAAADGIAKLDLAAPDLTTFDPFHLVVAEPDAVRLWSWDGDALTERPLAPGLHLVVNSGLSGPPGSTQQDATGNDGGPGGAEMTARAAHFRGRFAAVPRPEPWAGAPARAWGEWLRLADGDGLDRADPRALILRRDLGDGRIWGTTSVSLVALTGDGARFDFSPLPGDPAAWSEVITIHRDPPRPAMTEPFQPG
ncbi:MAG TPA: NRDE family protein [Streptosporangiaceae bacterium]